MIVSYSLAKKKKKKWLGYKFDKNEYPKMTPFLGSFLVA